MKEQRKLWIGLGAALMASTVMAPNLADQNLDSGHAGHNTHKAATLGGEGGEGGEGAAANIDLTTHDAAYLAQLGLVRGHLWVGLQLYKNGHPDMARTHMKHPRDELYSAIVPAMEARGHSGFADQLTALSSSVEANESVHSVERHYAALQQAMKVVESLQSTDLSTVLLSIGQMVHTAAEEYALGVKGGAIVNAHEYQDALGFIQSALQRLELLSDAQKESGNQTIAEVRETLNGVETLWPALVPEGKIEGEASVLYGAASRIQLAASDLD